MKWKAIPFPDKNTIYRDYISNFQKLAAFYPGNPSQSIESLLQERSERDYPRSQLATIFHRQHQQWGFHPAIKRNIDELTAPNTLAVVTGQQAGVFTSPLYTIYKIFTTIQQSRILKQWYPRYQFVPIFWMEVDDSDYQEINHCYYIRKDNQLQRLELEEKPEDTGKPIFLRKLPESITHWRDRIRNDFFPTEFLDTVLEHYFNVYQAGTPIATAFAKMLVQLFGAQGLLILNPSSAEVKTLGKTVFQTAIHQRHAILETFWKRNQQLETAGYHSQIHLKHGQTLLFWIDDQGRRVRLDCDDSEECLLRYSHSHQPVTYTEILREIDETPHRFTTNVALRPIFQDSILPTAIYVGGPAEVAYFAQLHALYPLFQLPMPAILPRHRITIVETKIQKIIQKYHIPYEKLFAENFHFLEKDLQQRMAQHPLQEQLSQLQRMIAASIQQLEPEVHAFDPTLVKALQHTTQTIQQALTKFTHKIQRAAENKDQTRTQQLERMLTYLFPRHLPQERVLAPFYFQIKYGWSFFEQMLETLPEEVRTHWVVEL